jgi:hypothetical protein
VGCGGSARKNTAGNRTLFYWLLLGVTVLPYVIFPLVFFRENPLNTETVRQTIRIFYFH